MRSLDTASTAAETLCQYSTALVPLALALGDLRPKGPGAQARPRVMVSRAPLFVGLDADPGAQPADWSLATFVGARVIDEAYLTACAAAQHALATALSHWADIDVAFGHAHANQGAEDRARAAARELYAAGAGIAGDSKTDAADAKAPVSTVTATVTDEDIVTLVTRMHGLSALLRALVQNDADGETATGALMQLRSLALALASVCADVGPALGAAWILHNDVGEALRFQNLRRQPLPCEHPSAVDALRVTRTCWLRCAAAMAELDPAVVGNAEASAALRSLFTVAVRWTDSCRRLHFRAASLYFATRCDIAAAVWCRVCALQAAPERSRRSTGLPVELPGVYTAPPPDIAPVTNGPLPPSLRQPSITVAIPTGVDDDGSNSAAGLSLMATALEAILPPPPRAVPWAPTGVADARLVREDTLLPSLISWRSQMRAVGCGLALEFCKPTEYFNWDLPVAYAALVRSEVDPTPLSTRVLQRTDTDTILDEARAVAANLILCPPRAEGPHASPPPL